MSRQLPERPNLQHLKKQAKELLRSMRQGKLADAQHAIANEYGFATWMKLKLHVESLEFSPAQALKAAVCDSDASRVRTLLEQYPELRAKIDDPHAGLWFRDQRALRGGATKRSGDDRCAASCRGKYTEEDRMVGGELWRVGRMRSQPGRVSHETWRGTGCSFGLTFGNDAEVARVRGWGPRGCSRARRRRADAFAFCFDRGDRGISGCAWRGYRLARCGS